MEHGRLARLGVRAPRPFGEHGHLARLEHGRLARSTG